MKIRKTINYYYRTEKKNKIKKEKTAVKNDGNAE